MGNIVQTAFTKSEILIFFPGTNKFLFPYSLLPPQIKDVEICLVITVFYDYSQTVKYINGQSQWGFQMFFTMSMMFQI